MYFGICQERFRHINTFIYVFYTILALLLYSIFTASLLHITFSALITFCILSIVFYSLKDPYLFSFPYFSFSIPFIFSIPSLFSFLFYHLIHIAQFTYFFRYISTEFGRI